MPVGAGTTLSVYPRRLITHNEYPVAVLDNTEIIYAPFTELSGFALHRYGKIL